MKIVLLIDHLSGFGGAQRVITNIANMMVEKGNEVQFILTGNNESSVYQLDNRVRINLIQDSSIEHMSKIRKVKGIRQTLLRIHPDIIISFLTMVNVLSIISNIGYDIPIIISERNDPDRCSKIEKMLSHIFYRFATCLVVQTDCIKKKVSKYYKKNIEVIANPLIDHGIEKTNYDISKRIVAVGRLNKQKNYLLLLDAFSKIVMRDKDYTLDIYGIGNQKEILENRCIDLNIKKNVKFMGNRSDVIICEPDYDFYVMSSDYEGMPNALAEAMSVGLPCISTDCDGGGAAALINNEKNGLLTKKGNVFELERAMLRYIENPNFAMEMGNNAKNLKIDLGHENIMKSWEGLIDKISTD